VVFVFCVHFSKQNIPSFHFNRNTVIVVIKLYFVTYRFKKIPVLHGNVGERFTQSNEKQSMDLASVYMCSPLCM